MSLDWNNSHLNSEITCPYNCWKISCTWQCINKNIPYKEIEILDEPKCGFCHKVWCFWDCQKIEILSKLDNDPYLINPLWNKWLIIEQLEKVDYWPYIEQEKARLLVLLSEVNIEAITWSELALLWHRINAVWWTIEWYEDLSKGLELLRVEKFYNKIEKNIEIQLVEKNLLLPTLDEVNRDLRIQTELVFKMLDSFIKSLEILSWKEITKTWNILVELWNKISKLEIMKKTLEITSWKY